MKAALGAMLLCALSSPAWASRSTLKPVEHRGDDPVQWPTVVQPQPLYVETPANAAARKRDPQDTSIPVPMLVASDVLLTGGCLKLLHFNAETAQPPVADLFAPAAGSSLIANLSLSIPSLHITDARLDRVHVGVGAEIPVLGVYCNPALDDVVDDVEVDFRWTGHHREGEEGDKPLVGSVRVFRSAPDVDPSEDLSSSSSMGGPSVGLCALFSLDAAAGTGWVHYWLGLGVDRIIMYFNGRFDALEEGEMQHIRTLISVNQDRITIVEWPFPYALPTGMDDATNRTQFALIAPGMVVNHCWHSFGSALDYVLFADTKDFPVFPPSSATNSSSGPSRGAVQAFFSGVEARYGSAAVSSSSVISSSTTTATSGGGGLEVITLPTFWAATSPTSTTQAGLEMNMKPEEAERIRGDLLTLHFMRGAQVLRHDLPTPGREKYGLARRALTSPAASGVLLCANGPCTNFTTAVSNSSSGGLATVSPGSPGLVQLTTSVSDGYSLRLSNAGVPVTFAEDRAGLGLVIANATVLDAGFRLHVQAAAVRAGVIKAPKASSPAPSAAVAAAQDDEDDDAAAGASGAASSSSSTCVATADLCSVSSSSSSVLPPPVARLHSELTKTQMHSDCDNQHRRYLVFSYAEEQGINGFAVMFQFYAAALALAHATGRTLVELLPPPPNPLAAAANGSNLARSPYSVRSTLYESSAEHDPWRRAPPHACNGSKMGCFLAPHSACALSGVKMGSIPRFDFGAEMKRLGRSKKAPHTPKNASAGEVNPLFGASLGGTSLTKPQKKKLGSALARIVRIDSMEAHRAGLLAATRGDFAPGWFKQSAAQWACERCASMVDAKTCSAADAAALTDHCSAYCSGGPELAWRRLWFPAFEAWLFKPADDIANATAGAVAKVASPPMLTPAGSSVSDAACFVDLPAAPRTATIGISGQPATAVAVSSQTTDAASSVVVDATGATSTASTATSSSSSCSSGTGSSSSLPHFAIGIHYRAGDASALVWRSHAPLSSYFQSARLLVKSLQRRQRMLDAEYGRGLTSSSQHTYYNDSVHVSLVVSTDSAAAKAAVRELAYDKLVGLTSEVFDESTRRTTNTSGSNSSADPMLALLDDGAHRLIEGDEKARSVVGLLKTQLLDRLVPSLGGAHFHRLVTSDAPLLKKSDAEAAKSLASSSSSKSNSSSSSGASATPVPTRAPIPLDKVVHLESHLQEVLDANRPKIRREKDEEDEGEDDDVFPSKDIDDARLWRIGQDSYRALSGNLSLAVRPPRPWEEGTYAAAEGVKAVTSGVVADIWLLSHANYLIGTCLSQVSRLAYELQYATGRARGPPVGLDARLCRSLPLPAPYSILADWRESADAWVTDGMEY